jgi:hypothetical protein
MDPQNFNLLNNLICDSRDEQILIQNTIRQLLRNLNFIVNSNDKDNFYNRFLVAKVGSNLYQGQIRPERKRNFDEMMRNNI